MIVVANMWQYESLARNNSLANHAVAGGDLSVLDKARQDSRQIYPLWDGYTENDTRRLDDAAWRYCETVAARLVGRVILNSCDLVERMKYDLFQPVRCALHVSLMADRLLAREKPKEIWCFEEMSTSFIWDPIEQPPDVFNAAVAGTAERRGVRINLIKGSSAVEQPHEVELLDFHESSAQKPLPDARIDYLAVCPAYDFIELELLLRSVPEADQSRWMVVTDPVHMNKFNLPSADYHQLFWMPFDLGNIPEIAGELEKNGWPQPDFDEEILSMLLKNPRLHFVWGSFCRSLVTGGRACALGSYLGRAVQPRITLVGQDIMGVTRCFMEGMWSTGVASIANWHAGLGHNYNYRRHIGVRGPVACWGEYDSAEIKLWRDPDARIFPVGTMRADFKDVELAEERQNVQAGVASLRRIVWLTTKVADVSEPLADMVRHMKTWEKLLAWARRNPDWQFEIKAHPRYDYVEWYRDLITVRGLTNVRIVTQNAREVLQGADAAVLVNYPSTVAMDACAMHVPLFYLKEANYSWATGLLEGKGIAVVESVERLESECTRLFSNSEMAATMIEQQKQFMARALIAQGEHAVRNMRKAVDDCASTPGVPEPVAAWMLRLMSVVLSMSYGFKTVASNRKSLLNMRREGQLLSIPAESTDAMREWGRYVMEEIIRRRTVCSNSASRPELIMAVYRTLPSHIRPEIRFLRRWLSQAFHQQSAIQVHNHKSDAKLYEAISLALAPGRLVRSL